MTFDELMNAYQINDDLCNRAVYNNLLKEIKSNHVSPVIGSGLSLWAGYPFLESFIREKAKGTLVEAEVLTLMNNNQFEKAMRVLSDLYKQNRFLRVLEKEFSPDKIDESKRPSYQKLLPELFKGPFVTTNYDVCLERLLNAPYIVCPQDEYNESEIYYHILNHKHILIKLRGTITDPTHLVVTEESSNAAYGIDHIIPDRSLPLIKTLETVFKYSSPLFLGCGFGLDRASVVLQSCVGATGYALVQMPENPDDFDEADRWFDQMNLQVIWYPNGKYEAVEVLINQLAKDMSIIKPSSSPKRRTAIADPYAVSKSFIGRDSIVNELAEELMKPETTVLLVHGVAGIGKTEICKAVYQKIKETKPDFSMPFVDISGSGSLPDFWERLADGLGIDTDGLSCDEVLGRIHSKVEKEHYMLYLDNFEVVLNALDEAEEDKLINSLHYLTEICQLKLLISSRKTIDLGKCVEVSSLDGDVDVNSLSWDELMGLNQTRLFVEKTGRKPDDSERDSFRTILGELNGHPLLIIITALVGKDCNSINELQKNWLEAELHIPGYTKVAPNSLLLANVLQSRGDLLRRTGELQKAMNAYDEAEKLFRAEHANLGLANVLQSRGDLLSRTGEFEIAINAYDEAEKLFRAAHETHGLANVLKSLGNLLLRIGKPDDAQRAFDDYKKLISRNQQNDYIAQEATKIIMDAMGNDNDVISNYHRFLDIVNSNATEQMLPYLTDSYSFLFALDESRSKLTATYDSELQDVIYQLFLIDCGKGISHQKESIVKTNNTSQSTKKNDSNVQDKDNDESTHKTTTYYSSPTDLEKATELVLIEFVNWLSEERKKQGLFFKIRINSHRQTSGLQYGYDIGVGTTENHERFNLCFECKHFKTLMEGSENDKPSILKVEKYSYNLLQYYMHCKKDVNNRWILVSAYGDLQNDFHQKLFENWNHDHAFLKIFAITESSIITCKDFLSVSEEAYKMVYGESPFDHKSKNVIFNWLNETIIGKDWIEEKIKERLRYSTVPLPEGYKCRDQHEILLRIQSNKQTDALNDILQSLAEIDVPFGLDSRPSKYGVFVIGEYGTGKTWLTCQTIERIIRHPGQYPYEPFFFELKGIIKDSESAFNNEKIKAAAHKYVDSKLDATALIAASKANASVFFLDGLDETLSGLSFTDAKISLLYRIMDAVRNVIPNSLFVVTSRESDYKACKNHRAFSKFLNDFAEIKLEDCTREQVRQNIKDMAAQPQKDAARLEQLMQNESFLDIICRPVFYSFLSCIVEREEFARNSNDKLEEYDVLDEIINSELQKTHAPADSEKKLFSYAISKTCNPDVTLTVDIENPEYFHENTIALIVPVGIFDITANSKTPEISFKHNIIREFLVAKYLYTLLKECVSSPSTDIDSIKLFIDMLNKVPMNVAIQKFFVKCISKDKSNSEKMQSKLLNILQLPSVKKDVELSTKLLEILFLPGSRLSGTREEKLDLTGIHAQNLYLWNCVLQNLDLSFSKINGLQLINADLNNINFEGATINNLQICSETPIVGLTRWQEGRDYLVILLLESGQLLQYTIFDQFDSEHIQVKLLGTTIKDGFDGVFHLNSNLYLFQGKSIYSLEELKNLYELNSSCKLLKIEPTDSAVRYLVGIDDIAYTLTYNDSRVDCCCIGQTNAINIDSFCFISNEFFAYSQEGKLFLQNSKQKKVICELEDSINCFCGYVTQTNSIILYLLSKNIVRIINVTNFEEIASEKELPIENVCKFFKHVKVVPLSRPRLEKNA